MGSKVPKEVFIKGKFYAKVDNDIWMKIDWIQNAYWYFLYFPVLENVSDLYLDLERASIHIEYKVSKVKDPYCIDFDQ